MSPDVDTKLPAAGALKAALSHRRTARTLPTPLWLHLGTQDLGEGRAAPIAAVNKTSFILAVILVHIVTVL